MDQNPELDVFMSNFLQRGTQGPVKDPLGPKIGKSRGSGNLPENQ